MSVFPLIHVHFHSFKKKSRQETMESDVFLLIKVISNIWWLFNLKCHSRSWIFLFPASVFYDLVPFGPASHTTCIFHMTEFDKRGMVSTISVTTRGMAFFWIQLEAEILTSASVLELCLLPYRDWLNVCSPASSFTTATTKGKLMRTNISDRQDCVLVMFGGALCSSSSSSMHLAVNLWYMGRQPM